MKKIVIVGTLHMGLTPREELREVLENIAPNKLLVELSKPQTEGPKQEMIFASQWAETHNIPVGYFDTPTSVFKEGFSPEDADYKELLAKQAEELKAFSWKDLNKKETYDKAPTTKLLIDTFIDPIKWEDRRKQMLANIKTLALPEGTTLVLTGTAHLNFFETELPEAEMPFR